MEHCYPDNVAHNHSKGMESEKWNSSSPFESSEMSNPSSGFDCNICLDSVQDPVVTLCGHLYCWPCIYKWINVQSNTSEMSEPQEAPQCPVCKSEISESTLVPLYALNSTLKHSDHDEEKEDSVNLTIPGRPKGPSHGVVPSSNRTVIPRQLLQNHDIHHPTAPYGTEFTFSSPAQAINLAGSTTFHPVIGMFGELLCARRFGGGSQLPLLYTNPGGSYSVAATSNARARRQVVQADRSLSRLSFFLCCCLVLCLLLF